MGDSAASAEHVSNALDPQPLARAIGQGALGEERGKLCRISMDTVQPRLRRLGLVPETGHGCPGKPPLVDLRLRCHLQKLHAAPPIRSSYNGCHTANWHRSDERRVGTACVSTVRSRWSPYQIKKNN